MSMTLLFRGVNLGECAQAWSIEGTGAGNVVPKVSLQPGTTAMKIKPSAIVPADAPSFSFAVTTSHPTTDAWQVVTAKTIALAKKLLNTTGLLQVYEQPDGSAPYTTTLTKKAMLIRVGTSGSDYIAKQNYRLTYSFIIAEPGDSMILWNDLFNGGFEILDDNEEPVGWTLNDAAASQRYGTEAIGSGSRILRMADDGEAASDPMTSIAGGSATGQCLRVSFDALFENLDPTQETATLLCELRTSADDSAFAKATMELVSGRAYRLSITGLATGAYGAPPSGTGHPYVYFKATCGTKYIYIDNVVAEQVGATEL